MKTSDDFYLGVLVSLQHIYMAGIDTLAEELVYAVGESALLRVATKERDVSLENLRRTVHQMRRARRWSRELKRVG